jgi:hypothetical protein
MDLKDIEKNYENMSDDKLIRIATTDAYGLRPGVLEIIEKEIKKRNLDPGLLKGAIAQNKEYTHEEIENYSNLLRELPCPICGDSFYKLNGTIVHTVKSMLVFTVSSAEPIIACPPCLDKNNDDAITSTALMGWWGIPWGIIKTPIYIYRNIKEKKGNRMEQSNEILLAFTLAHIGQIETYKDNKQELQEVIRRKL